MNFFRILVLLMMLGFSIATSGCGGGGAEIQATNTTMGQELHDIKKALDQGIITEKEYNRAKKDILKKYD
jgi:hypothetical protein